MFPSQMGLLKIVYLSNGPGKWYTLSMFPSQMVHLRIVFLSNGTLYPCFPRKWYILKLFPSHSMVHFIHVTLQMVHLKIVSLELSNGTLYPCFPCKLYTLKLFPSQMVHFIHVSLANVLYHSKYIMVYHGLPNSKYHGIPCVLPWFTIFKIPWYTMVSHGLIINSFKIPDMVTKVLFS